MDMGNLMLREMERAATKIFFWSGEKMFTVEAVTNKQNYKVYTHSSWDLWVNVRIHNRRRKAVSVMVLAANASDEGSFPSIFIDEGVKVKS